MNTVKISIFLIALFSAGQSMAECSIDLPFQKLMDCIVAEGSGDCYESQSDTASAPAKENGSVESQQDLSMQY